MENIYKLIVENISSGKIDKNVAIELIKKLKSQETNDDIAIIGMSVNLPQAKSVNEYWNNIVNKVDCVEKFPKSRSKDINDYLKYLNYDDEIEYVEDSYLDEIDKFDYKFFRLSPKEASVIDPNQRLFLQTAWSALEDAGYTGKRVIGSKTGVFLGFAPNLRDMYYRLLSDIDTSLLSLGAIGNLTAVTPSRISYLLDLRGPSMVVDTACSSSLVAVDLACQAIRDKRCDMAIAGGVKLILAPLNKEYMMMGIESSDFRTRSFDDSSDGSGLGEGIGAIILKPLKKAIEDKDNIYAVIKGSYTNQDGNSVGITAPNPKAQTDVIINAWKSAGVNPETISYIETHGTGTKLGDPIEIEGISNAFKTYTSKNQFCAISSVKTNIGHLSEPSGIISLIKAVMALKNKTLPPMNHFKRPNRAITFEKDPVYVNTRVRKWKKGETARRCGISSFGISGTNCHVVLEEAPEISDSVEVNASKNNIFTLTAKSLESLNGLVKEYIQYFDEDRDYNFNNICYTRNVGRGHYNYRIAIIFENLEDLRAKLREIDSLGFENIENKEIFYGEHKIVASNKKHKVKGDISEKEVKELNEKVGKLLEGYNDNLNSVEEICLEYVKGAEIEWEKLYKGDIHTVELPLYPFKASRCWFNIPDKDEGNKGLEENLCYEMQWKPYKPVLNNPKDQEGIILAFKGSKAKIEEDILNYYNEKNRKIVEVEFSDKFIKHNSNRYTITGASEEYYEIIKDLREEKISEIIHMRTLDDDNSIVSADEVESTQLMSFRCLINLIKAIDKNEIDYDINLTVLSKYVNEVTKTEKKLIPENAPMFGLAKVINKEYTNIKSLSIDIDDNAELKDIIEYLDYKVDEYSVVIRNHDKYIEQLTEINNQLKNDKPINIKEDGAYVVTGGLGGIGLEMSKYIASKNKVNLILINRSKMPSRDLWDNILSQDEDKRLCRKIKNIQEIEANGSKVICYSANVAMEKDISSVLDDVRNKFGHIDGIVHAAGVGDTIPIKESNEKQYNEVFLPKLKGTWLLDNLTKDDKIDFFIISSSISSVFAAAGQGVYMSANAYLDAYGAYRNKNGRRSLTINWTTWKEVGMAAESHATFDTVFKAMPTELAMKGFNEIFDKDVTRVLIGQLNFKSKIINLLKKVPFNLSKAISTEVELNTKGMEERNKKSGNSNSNEVILVGRESGEYLENEIIMAEICKNVLGFNEINIYDNFFELGADSILLMSMHEQFEKQFPGKIQLVDLFSYTNIADLVEYMNSQDDETGEKLEEETGYELEEFENVLDGVTNGSISVDDAINNFNNI